MDCDLWWGFPTEWKAFSGAVGSVGHTADVTHWCIIWGYGTDRERTVVSLFSKKWMVYDRYGAFRFDRSQTREPSLEPAAVAGSLARSSKGPVPNTEYRKDQSGPKTRDLDDELVLTPDALRYYDETYAKRREIADDVRTEAGECDFKLGDYLRVTWIPQQRADKALGPMFAPKSLGEGYQIARDGLLERLVQLPPPGERNVGAYRPRRYGHRKFDLEKIAFPSMSRWRLGCTSE